VKTIHIIEFLSLLNLFVRNVTEQVTLTVDYPLILQPFSDAFFRCLWISECCYSCNIGVNMSQTQQCKCNIKSCNLSITVISCSYYHKQKYGILPLSVILLVFC